MGDMNTTTAMVLGALAVLFVALIIIIALLVRMGRMLGTAKQSGAPAYDTAAYIEPGVPDEVVAAIAAAVACMMGGAGHSVRSVRRAAETGGAWRRAGMLQNTKAF